MVRRQPETDPGVSRQCPAWVGRRADAGAFGGKARNAKPLHGFGGAGVLEIVEDHQGDTYRAVYTVKLRHAVYVLHCFQKKSPKGSNIPLVDARLIQQRLREAELMDQET